MFKTRPTEEISREIKGNDVADTHFEISATANNPPDYREDVFGGISFAGYDIVAVKTNGNLFRAEKPRFTASSLPTTSANSTEASTVPKILLGASAKSMSVIVTLPTSGYGSNVCFVPIADILKSHGLQQSRRPRIRFLQKQGRKLFVLAQEFFDVILHLNTGMDNRPKMSGSDKRKKR